MTTRRSFTKALALSPFILPQLPGAFAQAKFPSKPVQMLVGFPPGQTSDIGARLMAKQMSEVLKQTVYVENKPGAATIIAHQALKAAPPDGYTIAYSSTGPLAINPTLYKKLPYDPQADFDSVAMLYEAPMFFVTHKNMPVNNFQEAVAYIKANPGKVEYGSGGSGLTVHITTELLKKEAGLDMLHVPYKGAPAMITDLIAGRVQFAFEVTSAILPFAEFGASEIARCRQSEAYARRAECSDAARAGADRLRIDHMGCAAGAEGNAEGGDQDPERGCEHRPQDQGIGRVLCPHRVIADGRHARGVRSIHQARTRKVGAGHHRIGRAGGLTSPC